MTNYSQVLNQVNKHAQACGRDPKEITLIAVSKTYPCSTIQEAYNQGCRQFGENRVQESLQKIPELPSDCHWHLIGTLQRNKISKALSHFQLIHSVDSPQLLEQIAQLSQSKGITTSVLLQLNLSGEKSKQGLSGEAWEKYLPSLIHLPSIQIEGLMTLAALTENQTTIRSSFVQLRQWHENWRPLMKDPTLFRHLSMGMSNDYLIAIEEGATLLRIGSAIFGARA
jgi:PLP dependent protein